MGKEKLKPVVYQKSSIGRNLRVNAVKAVLKQKHINEDGAFQRNLSGLTPLISVIHPEFLGGCLMSSSHRLQQEMLVFSYS